MKNTEIIENTIIKIDAGNLFTFNKFLHKKGSDPILKWLLQEKDHTLWTNIATTKKKTLKVKLIFDAKCA